MTSVPDLKIRVRPGAYAKSAETVQHILDATLKVLMRDGYSALSLRRIGSECGLSVGNISYHFQSKQALLKGLLDALLGGYAERTQNMIRELEGEDRLAAATAIVNTLLDVQSFQTTRLFPELWALANHDPEIEAWLQEFYRQARLPAVLRAERIRPDLIGEAAESVVLFISCMVEGSTIFAGNGKAYADRMPELASLAVQSLLHFLDTLDADRLRMLHAEWNHIPPERPWFPRALEQLVGVGSP